MGNLKRFLILVFLLISNISLQASNVFVPYNGIDENTAIWTYDKNKVAESIFQNPAVSGLSTQTQLTFSGSENYFGYLSFLSATVWHFKPLTIGLGFQYLGTTDIVRTTKTTSERPQISGETFGHSFQNFYLCLSLPLMKNIYGGAKLRYLNQYLDTSSLKNLTGDVGLYGKITENFEFGLYSQNLVTSAYVWSTSAQENLAKKLVLENKFSFEPLSLVVNYDFDNWVLGGGWTGSTFLDLWGLVGADSSFNLQNFKLGAFLNLDECSLNYIYTNHILAPLQYSTHKVGLSFILKNTVSSKKEKLTLAWAPELPTFQDFELKRLVKNTLKELANFKYYDQQKLVIAGDQEGFMLSDYYDLKKTKTLAEKNEIDVLFYLDVKHQKNKLIVEIKTYNFRTNLWQATTIILDVPYNAQELKEAVIRYINQVN
ncbi:hypothetical protein HN362_05485 [bacterium]|jgi:hypothetical protein|nr:hypothetical protein [bacterium]